MCRTMARCSLCNREYDVVDMVETISRKRGNRVHYMCQDCASRNRGYHTSNNEVVGVSKQNQVKCGIEFESSFTDEYARNAIFEYGFIPTHDGSLNSDGYSDRYGWDGNSCEYVSPIMQGLNKPSKFALTCDHLMQGEHLKVNNSCGTHFHVSVNDMKDHRGNKTYIGYIQRFYHSLFIPLNEAIASDRQKAERVFGRYFNSYAKQIDLEARPEYDRYLWINVKNDSNIEFRLNRFTSGKQYQNLMKMEVEMVKCIVSNFCEHFMDTEWDRTRYEKRTHYRKHKAEVTARKLVKIYEKYSANC